jgi:lipopolysaccharide cholinephosphotransferase
MFENNFEFDSEQLRQRYNPEGSKLRHDQLELLQMLKRVDAICKENNIQWWLSSGTLLGAARHKGFIPWDDDIDIVMLRKDYRRLEKILLKMEDKEFILHSMRSDVEYVNCFAKYRKRQGEVISKNRRYNYYKWRGIGFDIFTIEKTNYFAAKAASTIYGNLQHLTSYIRWGVIRKPLIRLIQVLCLGIIFPILRLIGLINPRGEYHNLLGTGWPRESYLAEDILPLGTINFEGVELSAPKNHDAYLTRVFGDWHKMPSDDAIKRAIHCQEYRDEIYGKEQ